MPSYFLRYLCAIISKITYTRGRVQGCIPVAGSNLVNVRGTRYGPIRSYALQSVRPDKQLGLNSDMRLQLLFDCLSGAPAENSKPTSRLRKEWQIPALHYLVGIIYLIGFSLQPVQGALKLPASRSAILSV